MFNLLCELHFWSQKDGILVDNSDFGAFVYQDRKSNSCPLHEGKKLYSEARGMAFALNNKRPKKLKESLAELEQVFSEHRVIRLEWKSSTIIRVVLDSGLQCYVNINSFSGDPEEVVYDKYMLGKFSPHYLSDVAILSHHAVFAFKDNHIIHAFLSKAPLKQSTKKWNALDVKLQNVVLPGPTGRRLDKTVSFNITGDLILMWWKCGRNEVYPWSPHVNAEDRANVHIYSLSGCNFDLVYHYKTKFDPIAILFSKIRSSTVYTIQQRVTDNGEVALEWENAEIDCRHYQRNYLLSLPLPTHVAAIALSPREDKLLATCIDGSLLVADSYGNIANRIRTNLIPSLASWHSDGAIILIANSKGQLQWFDSALTPVNCQIANHDASSPTLDVGSYFKYQPNLIGIHWNRWGQSQDNLNDYLLLQFEKGPLVILKLIKSKERKLTADTISYQYLISGAYNKAINLMYTIDWEVDSELAISTLQSIVSHLTRQPLSPTSECAIEKSLGFFLNPIRPIPEPISNEANDAVLDLARKFFNLLLRYQCFDTAFRLAIDLGERDLFMDIYHFCKEVGNDVMTTAAWERAKNVEVSSWDEESDSSCDCSVSHSSECSLSDASEATQDLQGKIVPPLPITTALESTRTKVGYSSILQQHNFRRNPPNSHQPLMSPSPAERLHAQNNRRDYSSQPAYVHHYLERDLDGTCLPDAKVENLFLEDSCIVHHPNIPSSRAPLQFNPHSVDHIFELPLNHPNANICAKVFSGLSLDQTVGVPYNLKVANVRRKTALGDLQQPQIPSSLPPLRIPNARREFQTRLIRNEVRMQPDGISSNALFSECKAFNKITKSESLVIEPKQRTQPFPGDVLYANVSFQNGETKASQNCGMNPLQSNVRPDLIEVSTKSSEPVIVASAETEDGKIKVVHFGLV